jgi:uncharacterized protein YjbI with pentapeptide repeats
MFSYEIVKDLTLNDVPESYKYINKLNDNDSIVKATVINDKTKEKSIDYYNEISKESVYEKIKNNEEIDLSHKYIESFSLKEYKKINSIHQSDYIDIKLKSAIKMFANQGFDCNRVTFNIEIVTFSAAQFGDGDVNFEFAEFGKGFVCFEQAQFGDGHVSFWGASFGDEEVSFQSADFGDGDVDFDSAKFGNGSVDFSGVNFRDGDVLFSGTTFGEGNVLFSSAKYGEGNVNFHNAKFGGGYLSFTCATIGDGVVDFMGANFGDGEVDFSYTTFGDGRVDFSSIKFGNAKVSFKKAIIGDGDVFFIGAVFGDGEVDFSGTKFGDGRVIFAGAKFGDGDVNFERAIFKSRSISFKGAKADIITFKTTNLYGDGDFRYKSCNKLVIEDCKIDKTLDLNISKENLRGLNLKDTVNLGKILMSWDKLKVGELIDEQVNTNDWENANQHPGYLNDEYENINYTGKANQLRMLKENFRNLGQYDDEDKAYVALKRYERKAKFANEEERMGFISKFLYRITHPLRVLVTDVISKYATSPSRVFITMLAVNVIFASIYYIAPAMNKGTGKFGSCAVQKIYNSFYFSAVTFLTIGYGDIEPPTPFIALLASIEGFLGLFLMAYFTISFARKVLR